MEQPMDCGVRLGAIKKGDDTVMDAVELSGYHPTIVTSSKTEPSKQSEEGDESAGLNAIEDGDITASRSAPTLLQPPRRRTWRRSRVLPQNPQSLHSPGWGSWVCQR